MNISEARFQYFYCTEDLSGLPNREVPTRDVTNTRGAGTKTEPHLEVRAENWCPCRARFVTPWVKRAQNLTGSGDQHYLLLTTRHPQTGEVFVVGVMPYSEDARARLEKRFPGRWHAGFQPYVSDARMK